MVYMDMKALLNSNIKLKALVNHVETYQVSVIAIWTVCVHFRKDIQKSLMRVGRTKELLKEIKGHEQCNRR
jgi:hypothetical protein